MTNNEGIASLIQALVNMKLVYCNECKYSEYDEVYDDRYCHYNGKADMVDDFDFCSHGDWREYERFT